MNCNCQAPQRHNWIWLTLSLLAWWTIPNSYGQTNVDVWEGVTNLFYSSNGTWTKTSNTNGLIWNSFPREGETVIWTGTVVEGKAEGQGTLQWFTNEVATTSYFGQMKAGFSDGHGVQRSGGVEYEGEWSRGVLTCTNGQIRFENGNWYKGGISNGFMSGRGEELLNGGQKYAGEYSHGRFNGVGAITYPNGDRLEGRWHKSKLVGVGTYYRKSGDPIKVHETERGVVPYRD